MGRTLAVKLKPAGEKAVKQGHPWVWQNSIEKISDGGVVGDVAIIFDQKKNKFLACGLYDPNSPIRIKVLQVNKSMRLDAEWIDDKFRLALDVRRPLIEKNTNSFRWIYGENDGLPGLIIDVYDSVAVVKLYSLIWQPYLDHIITSVTEQYDVKAIILRLSRNVEREAAGNELLQDGALVFGHLPNPEIVFTEYGVKFSANVIDGHKTGYFLDHRHNRHKVGKLSKGAHVLDVFSYAGGFSVHALAGGARSVTSLDISKQALELARKNAKLNNLTSKHKIIAGDAFEEMEKLWRAKKKYDIIVVDPPSFAKKADEVRVALKSYSRLTTYAASLTTKGSILVMASCSSRVSSDQFFNAVESTLTKDGHQYEIIEKTYHDIDHPIKIPEAAYLKCGYYRVV